MSRPVDWEPLSDVDPVPGDPHAVRGEAKRLGDIADTLEEQVRKLRKIGKDTALKGKYADRLQEESEKLADKFSKTEGRYQKVSSALHTWADDLEDTQRSAGRARTHAKNHEKDDDEVERAQGWLSEAQVTYQQQGQKAVQRIDEATDDDVEDSLWDDIDAWLDEHADTIKLFIEAFGWIATIIAVVAIFSTPAGWLVALGWGLAIAGLLGNSAMALSGNGSWGSVALSSLSLLTMGTGTVASKGIKAAWIGTKSASVKASAKAAERSSRQSLRSATDKTYDALQSAPRGSAEHKAALANLRALRGQHKLAKFDGDVREIYRPVQPANPGEAIRSGGSRSLSEHYGDIKSMRSMHLGNSEVQTASKGAEGWRRAAQIGGGTGTVMDAGAKWMGGSKLLGYEGSASYADTMNKFRMSQGSYWK